MPPGRESRKSAGQSSDEPTRTNEFGQPVGPDVLGWVEPPPPGDCGLVGELVRLRPLTLEDAPALFEATCGPGTEPDWTYMSDGPFPDVEAFTGYLSAMVDSPDWFPMVITSADGQPRGMACWLRVDRRHGTAEVGAIMFGRAMRGTALGVEAMLLMAEHIFTLGYRRYEWKCDSHNLPSRRAAEKLGFTFEGVFRNAVVYKRRNRDTAWYSMTDADWPSAGDHLRARIATTPSGSGR